MNVLLGRGIALSRVGASRFLSAAYCSQASIKERIDSMVKDKKVVVFMKGVPEAPRCGFSNAIVQILEFHGVKDYDAHNVLDDEELRQGKK